MKIWSGVLIGLALSLEAARAHQSPLGDISPEVSVVNDTFVIDFDCRLGAETEEGHFSSFRVICSYDGKLLVPRHRLHLSNAEVSKMLTRDRQEGPAVDFRTKQDKGTLMEAGSSLMKTGNEIYRVALRWREKGGYPNCYRYEPLPMTIRGLASSFEESATVTKDGVVAFTWGNVHSVLHLGLVSREGFVEGESIAVGKAAAIYSFPATSNPVWAAKRWWIAWVPAVEVKDDEDDGKRYVTMLSCYDPVTKRLTHQALPGESTWNTSLSLAVTHGWLCAAWNSDSGGDPSKWSPSRIVTAFHRLPEP